MKVWGREMSRKEMIEVLECTSWSATHFIQELTGKTDRQIYNLMREWAGK